MAEIPRMPNPDDVGEWLWCEARRVHSRVLSIVCRDPAAARIWKAVLEETRVPLPGLIVRLVAPRNERMTFRAHMEMSPDDMAYDVMTVEVRHG